MARNHKYCPNVEGNVIFKQPMIENIDKKIEALLIYRDEARVIKFPELRASICTLVEKAYFLEAIVLRDKKFSEKVDEQFFSAKTAVNRYFRDWNLDEVGDIFNSLCEIAKPYLIEERS